MKEKKKKKYNEKRVKKELRAEADRLWHVAGIIKWSNRCPIDYCPVPATYCHHYKQKGQYGHLRYDLDNAVPICNGHHFRLHHADCSLVSQIAMKRGKKWYNLMEKKAKEEHPSSTTVKWYRDNIERLTKYIEENKKLELYYERSV